MLAALSGAGLAALSGLLRFDLQTSNRAIRVLVRGSKLQACGCVRHLILELKSLSALYTVSQGDLEAKAQISPGSGTRPGRYSVQDDPARAATLATEYKGAIKAATLVALPPQIAGILRWSKSTYPSLDNP